MVKIVSAGGTLSTVEYLNKKQRARRKRLYRWMIIIIVLISVLVFVSRLPKFRISKINVSGAEVIDVDKVVSVVEDQMSGYYFWLLPKNNALIYPRQDVRNMISRKFPRFSAIALSLEGLKTLRIEVSEREPFALYCHEAFPNEESRCYFLDENGFIFDLAPSFSEGVYLVYSNVENLEEPLGDEFLPASEFKVLTSFISRFELLGLKPLSLQMSTEDFRIYLLGGAELVWKRDSQLERIFSNLESFLADPAIRGEKNFLERVSVLDLRTEDKVFYRFKDSF